MSNTYEITTMEIEERNDEDDEIIIVFDKEDDFVNNTNIYRYKLSEEIIEALNRFAKVHQYDDRKDFKSAWTIWVEDNKELVSGETIRLNELNYDGDILEKLFVSARYYFRKKSNEKKEPQKRRSYVGVNSALIDAMDKYIVANIILKPSESFDYFCNEYVDLLQNEVTNLYKNGMSNSEAIKTKIKKTYKNRHFTITQKKK
jgi:hypothetical protein